MYVYRTERVQERVDLLHLYLVDGKDIYNAEDQIQLFKLLDNLEKDDLRTKEFRVTFMLWLIECTYGWCIDNQ